MPSARYNLDSFQHFPESPDLEDPMIPLDDCSRCKGWGIVLGTDTPDSWGDDCDCGREYRYPQNVVESHELHIAHMQTHLHGRNK